MKLTIKTFSLGLLAFLNAKSVKAADDTSSNLDNLFKVHNYVKRPKLFELIDFNMPNLKINIPEDEYKTFFYSFECERDTNPNYLKRNEKCYTAPWVNLNSALTIALNKSYLDISKISRKDQNIVNKVVKYNNEKKKYEEIANNSYKISLKDFEKLVVTYSDFTLAEIFAHPYGIAPIPSGMYFETSNASMDFELNNQVTNIPKVKFSVGGRSTRFFSKLSYNINLVNTTLYETKQLRLRAAVVDPSFFRDKLAYDLHNLIELPSISANYAKLYINDTFMGLYLLRDAYKSQWVENNYGEKNTKHIYKCTTGDNPFFDCSNDDDDITEDPDWDEFLDKLAKAKNRKDLEEFFDVKTYIKYQAARYLFGSLDHPSGENNSVVYRYRDPKTNKDLWIPLLYDFDMNFGNFQVPKTNRTFNEEIVDKNNPTLYKLLNLNDDSEELISILDEIMRRVFNPNVLIPRIDLYKNYLDRHIKEDRTPDAYGNKPGRFPLTIGRPEDQFSYDDFKANCEFTTIKAKQYYNNFNDFSTQATALGLKQWIVERFKFVCNHYKMDCSYADAILHSNLASNYEVKEILHEQKNEGCKGTGYSCCILEDTKLDTVDDSGDWGMEGGKYCLFEDGYKPVEEECWSLSYGYPCCTQPNTEIHFSKSTQKEWGIENDNWCGITDLQRCPNYVNGYQCCTECKVVYTDSTEWGIEHGQWCSIPYSCSKQ